ncbi:MAG: N-acetylmuramoyl-L-alanine amidase [Clostridiaceae bacterium]|nr:N-acetylmuramoyl-L-alanine amidase [Clostridiaceae bacterium]
MKNKIGSLIKQHSRGIRIGLIFAFSLIALTGAVQIAFPPLYGQISGSGSGETVHGTGWTSAVRETASTAVPETTAAASETAPEPTPAASPTPKPTETPTKAAPSPKPTAVPTAKPTAAPAETTTTAAVLDDPADPSLLAGHVVVLDPGHQTKANHDLEAISPGSATMKAKTSSGTTGIVTHIPEYQVNLAVGLMLRDYLEARGCTVYLTRTTNDVDLSNIDRAQFAVSKDPDAYLRIHCNGSTNQNLHGVGIYIADSGLYKDQLPAWGGWLAEELCRTTGAANHGVFAGNTYTGLNWATEIPSFLVEMGYLTNPDEDRLLTDPAYQMKLCRGYAAFIARMPKR